MASRLVRRTFGYLRRTFRIAATLRFWASVSFGVRLRFLVGCVVVDRRANTARSGAGSETPPAQPAVTKTAPEVRDARLARRVRRRVIRVGGFLTG